MYSNNDIHKQSSDHIQLYLLDCINDFFMAVLAKKINRGSYEFGFIDFALTAMLIDDELHVF